MKRINFETAKLAKEAGFDIQSDCPVSWKDGKLDVEEEYIFYSSYKDVFPAPYQTKLQEWLREKHNIHIEVFYIKPRHKESHIKKIADNTSWGCGWIDITSKSVVLEDIIYKETHEEALEIGLQEALKTIIYEKQ